MARIETWFNQDLKEAVKVRYIDGNVFSADNHGNVVGVNVLNNGAAASISGSVSANIIRSDGATVAVSGTLSDNRASVVLPQSAYAVPGVISIIIKLTSGSDITTLCAVVANVYVASTDSVVDPGTIIPSVQTLIAQIEAAIASIPADYSSLWAALAPAYSNSTSYSIGQYVTYNGDLYKCTSYISGGETWNAAHWKSYKVGYELANLKYSFNVLTGSRYAEWEYGKLIDTSGSTVDITTKGSASTMSNCVVSCSPGDKFCVCGSGAAAGRLWCFIDSSGNSLEKASANVTELAKVLTAPDDSAYLVCNSYNIRPHSLYCGETLPLMESRYDTEISDITTFKNLKSLTSYTAGANNYGISNYIYLPDEGITIFVALRSAYGDVFYYDSSNAEIRSQAIAAHSVTELVIPSNAYRFVVRIKNIDGSAFSEDYLLNNSYLFYDTQLFRNVDDISNFNNKVYFTGFTAGSDNYGISNWVYPRAENVSFYAVLGNAYGGAFFYDISGTELLETSLNANKTTKLTIPEGTRRFFLRLKNSDGSNFSEKKLLANSYLLVNSKLFDAVMDAKESVDISNDTFMLKDSIKNRIIVDASGHGDYTTIHEAWASITDSSFVNQYEVCVLPGTYTENNITPPAFTHTHGIVPESVTITSYGGDTTYSVIDIKAPCKLSNMTIISYTKYCIHYDSSLNAGGFIVCEDLKLIQTQTGNQAAIGGGTFVNGTKYIWKSCIFINGYAHCHTSGQFLDWNDTNVIFENCKEDPAYGFLVQSVGGYGHCVYEINGSEFYPGYGRNIRIDVNNIRPNGDPWTYLAEPNEWQLTGRGNKNTYITFSGSGEGLLYETNSVNQSIELSGSAVSALFGPVKYVQGGSRIKGKAYGIYMVKDEQTAGGNNVYQMWKRLGNCSVTNKTLTVKVGSSTQTYTFTANYESAHTSESSIIASINASITIATLKKNVITEFWTGVNLEEKKFTIVRSDCITKGSFVDYTGRYCTTNTAAKNVWGIALEDGVQGDAIAVWTGDYIGTSLADGQYGVGQYGVPDSSQTNKVFSVSSGVMSRIK